MLNFVIGLIIILGICYGAFFFYQRQTLKKVSALENKKNSLSKIPLDDEFELTKKMNLTGESQKKFDQLHNKYQLLQNQMIPNIDSLVKDVKQDSTSINVIKTRTDLANATDSVNTADQTIKDIQASLAQINDLNKKHKQAVKKLENKYEQMRADLLDKNAEFGPSIDQMEKMLSDIETDFDKFSNLTKNGDPDGAQSVLEKVTSATNTLDSYMQKVPGLYHSLSKDFQDQINEISSGHDQMKKQGYNFKNDKFADRISDINQRIQQNLNKLSTLDVGMVEKNSNDIETDIDSLYGILGEEYKAKKQVDKRTNELSKYIDHVHRQNEDLSSAIEKLNRDYVLVHGEIENDRQYTQQISDLKKNFDQIENTIRDDKAIFSDVDQQQLKMVRDLSQIEKSQRDLFESISKIPAQEKSARDQLSKFDLNMRNKKRVIDNLNLPGLPESYTKSFISVVREIQKLDKAMIQPQINMDDVSKQLQVIESDLDKLTETTGKLIDNAVLSEQGMQYANRFKLSDPAVAQAIEDAQRVFSQQYDYEQSMQIIGDALEKAEKGSFKRIQESYLNQKESQGQSVSEEPEEV